MKADNLEQLINLTNQRISDILRDGFYEFRLNNYEIQEIGEQRRSLRKSLWKCSTGDAEAKRYVVEVIQDLLAEHFEITKEEFGRFIAFDNREELSALDKFEILLYFYEKSYGRMALTQIIREFNLCRERNNQAYYIDEGDIDKVYDNFFIPINELDMLSVLTQRVYEMARGLGVVDKLLEMDIDGVSGGVSGLEAKDKTVWIYYEGKSIQLRFLRFGTDKELERICCNIYRHNRPGQLNAKRGYIVNDMADHSRVVVARPPFCESWVFFVRKFGKKNVLDEKQLYSGEGVEKVIELLRLLIKGCQSCAITGMQGSGKTTLLMLLISYIPENYNLRIQELAFELHLRDIYPNRNIVTFRETRDISGQEGLDLQKKTDGTVSIIGEVATAPVAGWLMQVGQVASLYTMFTHHAKTTAMLTQTLANALLSEGLMDNEKAAIHQVAEVVRFDIHMNIDNKGMRYIERISELNNSSEGVEIKDIVAWEHGKYIIKNRINEKTYNQISSHLNIKEREFLKNVYAFENS